MRQSLRGGFRLTIPLLRAGAIAVAVVSYLALRIWIDPLADAELRLWSRIPLLFPRLLQFQAFYALAALIKARYILPCAILTGLFVSLLGPKRSWLYGLIVGGLTTLAWVFGYRAYWNHLPVWLDIWDAATQAFAVVAPALVAFCVSLVVALWHPGTGGAMGQPKR
jgi:hypothetical protein